MRSTVERLRDIQEAIANIEKYAKEGRRIFNENELIRAWFIRHLQIIGEIAKAIPQEFKNDYPAVPWKDIDDVWHKLIYNYFAIDHSTIWMAVERDIPVLKAAINEGLESLGENI